MTMPTPLPRAALFLVLVLGAALAPPQARAAAVDPRVVATVKRVKAADYPSANTLTISEAQSVVFQDSGQFTNTTHAITLVLTPEGKSQVATWPLHYTRDAEKMEIIAAQIIKADGSVVPVAAANIKDTEQSGEMNVYDPKGRSLQVTFEGLAVGDATDITYRLTRLLPSRPGFFDDITGFQSTRPILSMTYDVDGPAALPLTTMFYHRERAGKVLEQHGTRNGRAQHHWSAHDIEQVVPENFMNGTTELPVLVVTTDPSWEHFSAWWASLVEPQMVLTPALTQKADQLTRGASSDEQKIRALYNFVASDIRYRGLGVGPRSGYTPRTAEETLTSRWGVCRDVAILLTAMLRHEGFEAYPVLTSAGSPVLQKIAHEGFNHAIVAMPVKGGQPGQWTYLDPTEKNSSDLLPSNEREQQVLVATLKGQPLGTIPPLPPSENQGHVVSRSAVDADGTLTAAVKIEARGFFDTLIRSTAATRPAEEVRQTVEEIIHNALPNAQLTRFALSDPLAKDKPMQIDVDLKVPGALVRAGDFRLLRTLVTSGALGLDAVLSPVLGELRTRKYTLDATTTLEWLQDEEVALPAGLKLQATPNEAHIGNAVSQIDSTCTSAGSTIRCHRSFQLKSRFIEPKLYVKLKEVLAEVAVISRQPVILEAGPVTTSMNTGGK